MGIAVGMATNIPTHNLGEIIDGTIYLMEHPDCEITELMDYIKGPDFPTAAMICGTRGIYDAYTTGRGRITVRARGEVEEEKEGSIEQPTPETEEPKSEPVEENKEVEEKTTDDELQEIPDEIIIEDEPKDKDNE